MEPVEDIHVLPMCEGVSIHFRDIKEITETSITFDGYFRAEPELLPVRRIFVRGKRWLLVSIDSVEELEDTSKGWYDEEEGGYIVLTPTAIIKITYRILEELKDGETAERVHNELCEELATERKRNGELCSARERREWEAEITRGPNQDTCSQ
jgi:hypothetical protein